MYGSGQQSYEVNLMAPCSWDSSTQGLLRDMSSMVSWSVPAKAVRLMCLASCTQEPSLIWQD